MVGSCALAATTRNKVAMFRDLLESDIDSAGHEDVSFAG
jgi:hypothetical protein